MRRLKRENIDENKWNDCVKKSPNGLIYGLTWFLDALVDQWEGLIWEKNNEYTSVFPIPVRRKWGFKYVYPPFFIQQLGMFSWNGVDEQEAIMYLQKKFKFVELNLNYKAVYGEEKINLVLSLSNDYKSIYDQYSSNHRRNLKKAIQSELKISAAQPHEIIHLFRADKGKEINTLKSKDYERFQILTQKADQYSCIITKGVYRSNQLICGAIFMKFKNRIIFLFSGNSVQGRKYGALFLLLNDLIQQYAQSGFILDFEGSKDEGLAKFYQGFGAKKECYTFYKHNNLPYPFRKYKD